MTHQTRQLFGTDGIRGIAGEFPLTRQSTYLIGRALGHDLIRRNHSAKAVIGQDTRESSRWIADRVAAGLASVGVDVHSAGVITTPGVAFLARSRGFAAGVVISASHNPWTDNGIKVFSGDGFKLTDERELGIEKEIFGLLEDPSAGDEAALKTAPACLPGEAALRQAYIESLAESVPADLRKMRVLVDCANGAAAAEAPELFKRVGAQMTFTHIAPDGKNINEGCGALHPDTLGKTVAESPGKFDLGVTFDGDADRALFCDANGRVVNGDGVLLAAARDLHAQGKLKADTVVATTMSNMGLEIALRNSGIRMLRANVGDKYVLEEMLKTGATLGGEQSGHVIFRDGDATTGDGLLTALRVMDIMERSGRSLADLVADLKVFPQKIQNVRVREKVPFAQVPEVQAAIQSAERELDGNGRIVVRYSGTETLARVMVEAESEEKMQRITGEIAGAVQRILGA
ncbi:MAG TPA: phosphoglucosamine mutase [Candidatus Sulfotelmatobacter sp.]|nr:phosphoglucosamine mutase [Candidatus Sulfotelmatobacter sp.]